MRAALPGGPAVDRRQQVELVVAPDERRLAHSGAAGGLRRQQADRLEGGDGLRLALQRQRLEPLVLDRLASRPVCPLADRDGSGLGGGLEASRDVDGVADDGVSVADCARDHLAGVDADPQSKAHPVGQAEALVQLGHRLLHAEAGADRALGVVLVRDWRAEDGHHVVADVLVDSAAVAVDLLAEAAQAAVDEALHRLRVHALGDRRVSGEVGEDDGDLAALLGQGLRLEARRRRLLHRDGAAGAG